MYPLSNHPLLAKCSVPGVTASFSDAATGNVVAVRSDAKAAAELPKVVAAATFPSLPLTSVADASDVTRAFRSSAFAGATPAVDLLLGGGERWAAAEGGRMTSGGRGGGSGGSLQLTSAAAAASASASVVSRVSSVEVSEQRSVVSAASCPALLDAAGNPTVENVACMPGDAAGESCERGSVPSGGVAFGARTGGTGGAGAVTGKLAVVQPPSSQTAGTAYPDPLNHPAVRVVPAAGASSGPAYGMAAQAFSASLWVKRSSVAAAGNAALY
jgi:hypothetical protein